MTRWLLLALALGGCAGAPAVDPHPVEVEVSERDDARPTTVTLAPPFASVEMRFARRLPVVQATINGEGPFSFVVDTGAGTGIVVSERLARKLRLPNAGIVRVLSQGRFKNARRCAVSEVGIGGLKIGPVGGIVQDLTKFRPLIGDDYEGLLGFTLFRNLRITFDYPAGRFEMGAAGDQFEDGVDVLSYQLLDDTPVVPVVVGSWQLGLTIDTGSSFGVVLPPHLYPKMKWLRPARRGPSSLGVTGRVDHRAAYLDGTFKVGQHAFANPRVIFGAGYIGLLGGTILRRFRVTLDPLRRTVGFVLPK